MLLKIINTFELSVEEDHDMYYVTIKTDEEASTVIGRHGETIRAIQKILEVILYKSLNESVNILINVNDYREKQKERLHQMAAEMADKTINSSKPTHVRGLSSYERIMHEYLLNIGTHSVFSGEVVNAI
jgi:spoIIIJ-associated protein